MDKGFKINVLDAGWVQYMDSMGVDADICSAARTSFGNDEAVKGEKDNRTLLRYLMRHQHMTPFEMVQLKFRIFIPMDAWRQFVRHRTFSINEYSTRYSEAIETKQTTAPNAWRLQSTDNKQGSSGILTEWPVVDDEIYNIEVENYIHVQSPGEYLSEQESNFHCKAHFLYQRRLEMGVAKEQARKDLPLSTYTRAVVSCDLRNMLHFLWLRLDSHAQQEIREYAEALATITETLFPLTYQAFLDYRLNSVTLSALEISVLTQLIILNMVGKFTPDNPDVITIVNHAFENKREARECTDRLVRLGLLLP